MRCFANVTDIDECQSSPCLHGQCEDQEAGYKCHCNDGWSGVNCDCGKLIVTVVS